jgi:hypothetical protein
MIYNKSVDINIPENEEKGNTWPINRIFVVGLVLLLGIGGFGLQKLYTIEHGREAVSIENTISDDHPLSRTRAPSPFHGGWQTTTTSTTTARTTGKYVAARGGTVYYLPTCSGAKRISDKNKIWFDTKAEAEKFGYKPAQNCKGM